MLRYRNTSPILEYNLRIRLNRLRNELKIPIQPENIPSLKSISTQYVASFFTHETAPLINALEILETLKEDVKRFIY